MSTGRLVVCTLAAAIAVLNIACVGSPASPTPQAEITPAIETPKPVTESERWQRYVSQTYGYEFQYPASCEVSGQDEDVHVGGRIELAILASNGLSLDEFVKRFVDERADGSRWMVESISPASLGGQEAMTVDFRFGGQGRFGTATFVVRGGNVYIWDFTAGAFACAEPDVYGPILESFRFAN